MPRKPPAPPAYIITAGVLSALPGQPVDMRRVADEHGRLTASIEPRPKRIVRKRKRRRVKR